jgi:hypothetical protein
MIRKIIKTMKINATAAAFAPKPAMKAIGMADGKAKAFARTITATPRNCLPACPTGPSVSKNARRRHKTRRHQKKRRNKAKREAFVRLPGTRPNHPAENAAAVLPPPQAQSRLSQWPVPDQACARKRAVFQKRRPFGGGRLQRLRFGDFHNHFIKNKVTLIGCPSWMKGSTAKS